MNIRYKLHEFYHYNLLVRLVMYIFLSKFIATSYVELILGEAIYYHPRISQWIFYGFLFLECLISVKKIIHLRVKLDASLYLAVFLLGITIHGITVGVMLANVPFTIINDAIPILMITLNVLRINSSYEHQEIDTPRLFSFLSWFVLIECAVSLAFSFSEYSVNPIYFAFFAGMTFSQEKITPSQLLIFFVVLAVAIPSLNRTNLIFLSGFGALLLGRILLSNPLKFLIAIACFVIVSIGTIQSLPEDSKLAIRLNNSQKIDLNSRTGSVGERQQEWASIQREEKVLGKTYDRFGLGFGGTYFMRMTHEVIEDYGHAHYSWAWFKLRFGNIGFIYLAVFMGFIAYSLIYGFFSKNTINKVCCALCCMCILYSITYVNAIFLMMGIQFYYKSSTISKSLEPKSFLNNSDTA